MASSIARRVPEPIEKCAVRSASPISTTLPADQRSLRTFGKLRQIDLFETSGSPSSGIGEHALQIAVVSASPIAREPGALPGRGVALDDERAHVRRMPVVMRVERAVLVRTKVCVSVSNRWRVPYQANLFVHWRDASCRNRPLRRTNEFAPSAATTRS